MVFLVASCLMLTLAQQSQSIYASIYILEALFISSQTLSNTRLNFF